MATAFVRLLGAVRFVDERGVAVDLPSAAQRRLWIMLAETMEEVDIATGSLAADGTYLERIDDAGPLFLPDSTSQHLLRRLT